MTNAKKRFDLFKPENMPERKPTLHIEASEYSKLSISVPAELKPMISQRAAELDLTVSQYIRWLAKQEMGPNPLEVQGGKSGRLGPYGLSILPALGGRPKKPEST